MASNMPVRLLTIPLPMSGPQQAERLFPPTAMPSSPASTSETMSRMAIIVWLGAQGFHNRDDQVRRILAEVQNIICLDGRFEIVVEGGVVEFFPGPIDLVEHRIFHIISLLLQLFDLPGEFDCLGPVGPWIAVIDKDEPGGICLTRGCIPSKILLYPAELVRKIEEARDLGIDTQIKKISFEFVMDRMRKLIYTDIDQIREGLSGSKN